MKHASSVVIVSWQRSEHGYSSLRYETCSVSCHRLMTTVRAWLFIPKVWNMLGQLSSPHDNTSEHGYSSLRYETCSVSCYRLMTTVRAWLFIPNVWNMLRTLSSSHDKGQSMVIHPLGMKHAPLVVIVTWQWSEHGYISFMYETCSDSCRRLMTMDREGKKHAPSVVIVSWRRSEHGYSSFR